jgi:hypothetical protein
VEQESYEAMIKVMDQLQGHCIFHMLMDEDYIPQENPDPHRYEECQDAEDQGYGFRAYRQWRQGIELQEFQHCWECGLPQAICQRFASGSDIGQCEYPNTMLPGIFMLHQRGYFKVMVQEVGFQGEYEKDVWEWLNEIGEGFGEKWESNWTKVWRNICKAFSKIEERIEV